MKRQMISLSIIVVLFMCLSDVIIADDQKFLGTTDRQTMMYQPMQDEYDCGDANIDGTVNVVDIVYLWNYLFKGGPLPYYAGRGDIDGIKGISNNDAVRLADYLYMGGSLWPACAPFLYDPIPQSLDTIRFTNLTVAPNQDTVTVEVWLSVDPDDTVTGLSIPFTFYCPGSAYIYCDYIDRTGGLFESHNLSLTYIDTANNYAMFAVGGPALGGIDITGPATGLAFTAQFTVEPSPTGRTIDIFSANPYRGKLELSLRDGGLMAARPVVIGIDFEDIYAVNPFPHEAQVGNATSISVTFSEQMDGSSIAESTVVVQGNMTGYHAPVGFQYSGTTHTLVWHLSLGFLTGEMVSVSVAPGLEVQDGTPLDDPRAWMFTVGSGDALGAFGTDTVYSVGSEPHCVYAGDFDNNGYPDFATADHNSNNVSVWLNDGAGGFTGYATYGVGSWPRSIYGGDFNKDGYLDLAVANYTSGNVTILRNDMDGTFTPYGPYSVGANPTSIIVADLSNDGHQDLAVSNSADDNISVLLNNAGGGFDPQSTFPVGNLPYGVGTGDMDLDGDIDLAVANQDGNSITVLLNDGAGSFTTDSVYSVSSELMSICVADLNNDLYPDLAVPSYTASEIGVLFNNGDATFGGPGTHTVGSGANCVIANDLDGDGFLDLMTANTNEDSISVLLNDGYGGFAAAVSYSVGSGPGWVAPFDYDFDGDLDLVVSNRLAGTVSILRNQNTGITVTNLTDAGDGSLRWAIEQANTNPGSDTITFAVSGVIEPLTALPSLTDDSTTILGSSAPGGAGGVIISGTNVPGSIGLTISSSRNRIEGLIIDGFNDGIGVNGTARGNWIGPDNVIQASEGNGLSFNGAGTDSNSVIGNTIINNNLNGVYLTGTTYNRIGGYISGRGNGIYENGQNGVYIYGNSDFNKVIGNTIGVPLGELLTENLGDGVTIDFNCDDNLVDSNLIAQNGNNGVNVIINSLRNTITRNTIYGSGLLAIDLADDGVTANDVGDGDTGPNNLLNYPEIDSIYSEEDESYMIYGRAIHDARVEFFVAHPADDSTRPEDPSGHGEAWYYIGYTTAAPTGEFAFHDTESEHFSLIACTATDSLGNTSEMSENFTLYPRPMIVTAFVYTPSKGGDLPQNGVNIIVEDPNSDQFGRDSLNNTIDEIPGEQYYAEGPSEDTVIIPEPIPGVYTIYIIGESGSETGTCYAAIIKTDGLQCNIVIGADTPASGTFDSYEYTYDETWEYDYLYGDANCDRACNVADAVYIINYVFKGGLPPEPEAAGDANCDTVVNVSDAVYIVNYVFKGGPAPCTW